MVGGGTAEGVGGTATEGVGAGAEALGGRAGLEACERQQAGEREAEAGVGEGGGGVASAHGRQQRTYEAERGRPVTSGRGWGS